MTSSSPLQKRLDYVEAVYGLDARALVVTVLHRADSSVRVDRYVPWLGREIARAPAFSRAALLKWAAARLEDVAVWAQATKPDLGRWTWKEVRRREAAWARKQERYRLAVGERELDLSGGWAWWELRTSGALRRAATELRNCLKDWSVVNDIRKGQSRVFLLRDEQGRARGAVEIRGGLNEANPWQLVQAAGKANVPWPEVWSVELRALSAHLDLGFDRWRTAGWAWDEETFWFQIRRWKGDWHHAIRATKRPQHMGPVGQALAHAMRVRQAIEGGLDIKSWAVGNDQLGVEVALTPWFFRPQIERVGVYALERLQQSVRRRIAHKTLLGEVEWVVVRSFPSPLGARRAHFALPTRLGDFEDWAEAILEFLRQATKDLVEEWGPGVRAVFPARVEEAVEEAARARYPWMSARLAEAAGQERLPLPLRRRRR